MASRVRSTLDPSDHQLLPKLERDGDSESPHNRQRTVRGLKRKMSLRDSWKRKMLALPPEKRQKAIKSKSRKILTLKRVTLKKESKGHKAEIEKYNASAEAFFEEPGNDVCHICLILREDGDGIVLRAATERHHVRGRIGRLLNWRPGQMPSCRGHRSWPHDHPARARKLGILCDVKDWNVFPD